MAASGDDDDQGLVGVQSGKEDEVFPCCNDCTDMYLQCLSHMDIVDVLRGMKDPGQDIGEKLAAARKHKKGATREFPLHTARENLQFYGDVNRKYTIMNEKEFCKEMGVAPLQQHTRHMPVCRVRAEGSAEMEKVWMFDYEPSSPLRTLTLVYRFEVEKVHTAMDEPSHIYPQQGEDMVQYKQGEAFVAEMEFELPNNLRTIADFKKKLSPGSADAVAGSKPLGKGLASPAGGAEPEAQLARPSFEQW